jgi:hypothetical protein
MAVNFTDFYISYPGHPRYNSIEIIEDDVIRVILQKYEMLLMTNKGEVYGFPNLGCDLEELLHETKVSADFVEGEITQQIFQYIPEISGIDFNLNVKFYDDPERFQEWMEINFQLRDYDVYVAVL